MYFAGHPLNARDRLLNGISDAEARARLIVALRPAPPGSDPQSAIALFDIVLGAA
jgi:protocatechuate 3,4-dioxygenase beta subunit